VPLLSSIFVITQSWSSPPWTPFTRRSSGAIWSSSDFFWTSQQKPPFGTYGRIYFCTPLIHMEFTHRRQSQPRRATASSSGAVRLRFLTQGHLDTQPSGYN
jgi:hypothetical protein